MKPSVRNNKQSNKKKRTNGYISDDENIRYKLNPKKILNGHIKKTSPPSKNNKQLVPIKVKDKFDESNNIRYSFPDTVNEKNKIVEKKKSPKSKLKVNFWSTSSKSKLKFLDSRDKDSESKRRRHTIPDDTKKSVENSYLSPIEVPKKVSFLPTPLFLDNHVPMVAVPDDLTLNFDEDDSAYLLNDNHSTDSSSIDNSSTNNNGLTFSDSADHLGTQNIVIHKETHMREVSHTSNGHIAIETNINSDGELEYFSKYIVQKLRKMETNQRIYAENLINTVLMLGQLYELNSKVKIQPP